MNGGADPVCADRFADDLRRIAAALRRTGIVHRDINEDNLIIGDDGRLKLIDFQFAVDRSSYRESDFMLKNWKYLYIVFAFSEPLGGATWNDMRALRLRVQLLPETDFVRKTICELKKEEEAGAFSIPVTSMVRFKLRFYLLSLLIQRVFRDGDRARNVIDKRIRLSRTLLFRQSARKTER